jgi:hypothetical protein
MTARRSATETGIPLYLIPHAIARQIHKQGKEVYRISVKRVNLHHYNITVRTKSPKRELRAGRARDSLPRHLPEDSDGGGINRDGESGGVI